MANIILAWDNAILAADFFTPSSEAAGYDADNLANPHPSAFWRLTTLSGDPNVLVDYGTGGAFIELYAVLYATATPHQNALEDSNRFNEVSWTKTNLDGMATSPGMPVPDEVIRLSPWNIGANGSGEHYLSQSWTKPNRYADLAAPTYVFQTWLKRASGTAQARIAAGGTTFASNYCALDINLGTGAAYNSGDTGNFTLLSYEITALGDDWYRCGITFTCDTSSTIDVRAYVLNSSFTLSYTAGTEHMYMLGPLLYRGSAAPSTIMSADMLIDGSAPFWAAESHWTDSPSWPVPGNLTYTSGDIYFAPQPSLRRFTAGRGWYHSFHVPSVAAHQEFSKIYLWDPDNVDAQLDVSNIYAGPIWQPSVNFQPSWQWLAPDPMTGSRILQIEFAALPESEVYEQLMPMLYKCKVGRPPSTVVTNSGQEYRPGHIPVLAILDPAETEYTQEQTLYAYIDDIALQDMPHTGTYRASLTFREVMP